MSNPKLHWKLIFAGGPLIPAFAKKPTATGGECWNRTTGHWYSLPRSEILVGPQTGREKEIG
jgi:hypothetical protein